MATNQRSQSVGAADVLHALGDGSRRSIVESLRDEPLAVGQIADRLPISRPAISQHLKVLEDAGVVTHRSRGTRNVYAIDPAALEMLRGYLDVVWRDGLESFRQLAEGEST